MKIINDNIFNGKEDIIIHQVNCLGIMGGGIAKQIKKKYPDVFKTYKTYVGNNTKDELLGKNLMVESKGRIIANVFGQKDIGTRSRQTDYKALERGLKHVRLYAELNNLSVAIPFNIGCGLGGGDWNVVKNIIESVFENYPVTIYKL